MGRYATSFSNTGRVQMLVLDKGRMPSINFLQHLSSRRIIRAVLPTAPAGVFRGEFYR